MEGNYQIIENCVIPVFELVNETTGSKIEVTIEESPIGTFEIIYPVQSTADVLTF